MPALRSAWEVLFRKFGLRSFVGPSRREEVDCERTMLEEKEGDRGLWLLELWVLEKEEALGEWKGVEEVLGEGGRGRAY